MNLIPRKFTSLQAAIEYASVTKGIIYRFGTIFKVYIGNCPQPLGVSAAWSSPDVDQSTLIQWLNTLYTNFLNQSDRSLPHPTSPYEGEEPICHLLTLNWY